MPRCLVVRTWSWKCIQLLSKWVPHWKMVTIEQVTQYPRMKTTTPRQNKMKAL